jgi:uncharacterized membrane protein YphA (DoxX/SURF4 family)
MNKEPVTLVAIIQVLISAAVAFGLKLTGEQVAALLAVTTVIGALIARQFTWSNASVEKVTNDNVQNNLKILESKRGI